MILVGSFVAGAVKNSGLLTRFLPRHTSALMNDIGGGHLAGYRGGYLGLATLNGMGGEHTGMLFGDAAVEDQAQLFGVGRAPQVNVF